MAEDVIWVGEKKQTPKRNKNLKQTYLLWTSKFPRPGSRSNRNSSTPGYLGVSRRSFASCYLCCFTFMSSGSLDKELTSQNGPLLPLVSVPSRCSHGLRIGGTGLLVFPLSLSLPDIIFPVVPSPSHVLLCPTLSSSKRLSSKKAAR